MNWHLNHAEHREIFECTTTTYLTSRFVQEIQSHGSFSYGGAPKQSLAETRDRSRNPTGSIEIKILMSSA